ncbi:tetratricopeptide repeat protein [uncultured Gulosibacter sp.]|uniref:tetratricopeptide repeat protein n=1 Tax=uncultured Gulosibacter sp. TaxID=1339167 RepID=UPI00288C3953|nr:tetratricopeptide repeat protein [uncultured Gulosibacter sp.]
MADDQANDGSTPIAGSGGAVDLSTLAGAAGAQQPQPARAGSSHTSEPQPADAAPSVGQPGAPQQIPLPDVVIEGSDTELEQFAQLSTVLPVLVQMHASWSHESSELVPVLEQVVRAANGRIALLRIDLDEHPHLGRQPQTLALFAGQPMPLFNGNPPREQIEQLVAELIQAATQRGMTATIAAGASPAAPAAEPELPPLHQAARDALERGDIAAAQQAYEQALAEQPGDNAARTGLAQVRLLGRLQGKTLAEIRERAAENPNDLASQLEVADLDLSGGHVDDACNRLLALFNSVAAEGKTAIRERLLEYFEVVGNEDARVQRARQQLTNLLFA